jgi:hypothetical protein
MAQSLLPRQFFLFTGMIFFLIAALLCSCERTLHAVFLIPEKTRNLMEVRDSVEVHLRLIPESLLENELRIVNNSKSKVYINPKEIFFAVNGRDIKVSIEEDYDAYIMRLNSNAALQCNESDTSDECVEAISALNNSFKGKGFTFFAIEPGKESRGYIAFSFPTPLNDSPVKAALMKEFYRNNKTLRGAINVELIVGDRVVPVLFPIEIRLYSRIKKPSFKLPGRKK